MEFYCDEVPVSGRIEVLKKELYEKMPAIEEDRGVIITKSYMETEGEPMILRRAKAFAAICDFIPITIRPGELVVGSATKQPRSCQVFPEFSCEWLEKEFDTISKRSADPFFISEDTKVKLREVYTYWKGKTTSELAESYMEESALKAIEHGIFTPGNYFYNGIGHVTVNYEKVLEKGYGGIKEEAETELRKCKLYEEDYGERSAFLKSVVITCDAAIKYSKRYGNLAKELAAEEKDKFGDCGRTRKLRTHKGGRGKAGKKKNGNCF